MLLFASSVVYASEPITVTGIGDDFIQARNDAFRQAIDTKIGVLMVSQKEFKNDQVVLKEILLHSSGYIDKYKILENRKFHNRVEVTMQVTVSDSKIANRLRSPSTNTLIIDGERHAIQRESFLNQVQTGDRLLQSLLNDFPVRAFYLNTPFKPVYSLDNYGNDKITISYHMGWKYEYLRALHEILDELNDGPKGYLPNLSNGPRTEIQLRGHMFGSAFTKQQWYTFSNPRRIDMIKNVFENKRPALRVQFFDNNNNLLSDKCYDVDKSKGPPFYNFNKHTKVTIEGEQQLLSHLHINLDFPVQLLHKYELSIIPNNICVYR